MNVGDAHFQPFRDTNARMQAQRYLRRLERACLTPEIIELTEQGVRTRRGLPLAEWWPTADPEQLSGMRGRLLQLIEAMHTLGVCHRDLHDRNVVIGPGGRPLAIDLELACDLSPGQRCYDLRGPSDQIPVPVQHIRVGGSFRGGVWWGSRDLGGYRALGEIFGPLDDRPK